MVERGQQNLTRDINKRFQSLLYEIDQKLIGIDDKLRTVHVDTSPLKQIQARLKKACARHAEKREYDHIVTMDSLDKMMAFRLDMDNIYNSINKYLDPQKADPTLMQKVSEEGSILMYKAVQVVAGTLIVASTIHAAMNLG